jgi:hypothetical protein
MSILPQVKGVLQAQVLSSVPLKWLPMFSLGVNAFSLTPFRSINANARLMPKGRKACESQVWRLTGHGKICNLFPKLLLKLFKIDESSILALDFSSFGCFQVLCLALQTREGRSIPVWFTILRYPIKDATSQNWFILSSLRKFVDLVGYTPRIVCDRGFIGWELIRGFLDLRLTFYVRMKAGKYVRFKGKRILLKKLHPLDAAIRIYGKNLRVVRSSKTLKKKLHLKECWYIITNDLGSTREEILTHYYYRFEIEEAFKDLKHLLDNKPRWIKKIQTIKVILWFQILGIWIIWKIHKPRGQPITVSKNHPKHKRSWLKILFEEITKERLQLILPTFSYRREVMFS